MHTSPILFILPPFSPVKPIVNNFFSFANFKPLITFFELPPVDIPMVISPSVPIPSNFLLKIRLKK
jgi:hypothetical protein